MPKVFISYSHQDAKAAETLQAALEAAKVEVWRDSRLTPLDADFHDRLNRELELADWVVVLWSRSSLASGWVKGEAFSALERDKILQVRIEDCRIQAPFNIHHIVNLIDWQGEPAANGFRQLLSAIATKAAGGGALPDDDDTRQLRQHLQTGLGLELLRIIGTGDISTVYLARKDWRRHYAVKVIHELDGDSADIERELALTQELVNPCFMRLFDVRYSSRDCMVVGNYVPARHLEALLSERSRAGSGQGTGFPVKEVIDTARQLAEALTEAHLRGLRYLRLAPREVFLQRDHALQRTRARISPINFAYRAELLRAGEHVSFTQTRGPYTAPEVVFNKPKPNDPDWSRTAERADQFSLGMLAWTMLEGVCPFDCSDQDVTALTRAAMYHGQSKSFSQRLLSSTSPWRLQARALARVLARMVEVDPARRWASMKEVSSLFQALDADQDRETLRNSVKALHTRICRDAQGLPRSEFYRTFYERLFAKDSTARAAFGDSFDIGRQQVALDVGLEYMFNFSQAQHEPTPLTRIASHHARFKLSEAAYRAFGEAMIETFALLMPDDDEKESNLAALEIIIWPAIGYFMERAAVR